MQPLSRQACGRGTLRVPWTAWRAPWRSRECPHCSSDGKREEMEHGVVEAYSPVADGTMLALAAHISPAEDSGSHGDKRSKHRQIDAEGIDEEKIVPCEDRPTLVDLERQHDTDRKGGCRAEDVHLGRKLPGADEG